ncbi:MAG: hypothetical protein WDN29_01280 [Methylovirgula sp.]
MRLIIMIAAALAIGPVGGMSAQAQSNDPATEIWLALPENPDLQQACSTTLRYSSTIDMMKAHGASLSQLLRWAERESERSATDAPSEPLFPIGTILILSRLIQESYIDAPILQSVALSFPQFAYRSCLKGKPIDQ